VTHDTVYIKRAVVSEYVNIYIYIYIHIHTADSRQTRREGLLRRDGVGGVARASLVVHSTFDLSSFLPSLPTFPSFLPRSLPYSAQLCSVLCHKTKNTPLKAPEPHCKKPPAATAPPLAIPKKPRFTPSHLPVGGSLSLRPNCPCTIRRRPSFSSVQHFPPSYRWHRRRE